MEINDSFLHVRRIQNKPMFINNDWHYTPVKVKVIRVRKWCVQHAQMPADHAPENVVIGRKCTPVTTLICITKESDEKTL